MSSLFNFLHRLLANLLAEPKPNTDLDGLSLHDWADLPPHHPLCD